MGMESLEKFRAHFEKCGLCRCGFCRTVCPVYELEEYTIESQTARGRNQIGQSLLEGLLEPTEEVLKRFGQCACCNNCLEMCGPELDTAEVVEHVRQELIKAGVPPQARHKEVADWIKEVYNPFGDAPANRKAWLPADLKLPKQADVVYFAGCMSSYREQELAKSTVNVLRKLGVSFTMLNNEVCCGSVLQRTGQTDSVKELAQKNMDGIKATGAKTIVTTCSGCYRTLKLDYPNWGVDLGDIEVKQTTEFLANHAKHGKMPKLEKAWSIAVTFHDPCHLGRHVGVYDEPREILTSLPGIQLVEMERTRENSRCCGAGAGLLSGYPELAKQMAEQRVDDAKELNVEALVTTCPFCVRHLRNAATDIKVYDVIEMVDKALR